MLRVDCYCLFDITATGVTSTRPGGDQRARNQQRNWETLNQILALRTLPENTTVPKHQDTDLGREWRFEFDLPGLSPVSEGDRPLGLLLHDCQAVPMITGLTETAPLVPELCTQEPGANIWFELTS